jgi:peptidoglycan/LPS O-acetylase OafA/YrhL
LAFLTNEALIRMPEYRPGAGTALPLPIILPLKLTLFLIGMAIAEANRRFRAEPAETALVVALALFFAAMQSWQVAGVAAIAFYLVAGRGSAASFAGRCGADWLRFALGNRLMVFLADCSYPVYLLHSMAIPLWGRWLWRQDWVLTLRNPVRMLLLLALVTATVYPLAWLVHRWVERPGIEVGRHVGKRLFPGETRRPVSRAA